MPDSALNRRSEALSGWKHNKCPLLPLNYPENPFFLIPSQPLATDLIKTANLVSFPFRNPQPATSGDQEF